MRKATLELMLLHPVFRQYLVWLKYNHYPNWITSDIRRDIITLLFFPPAAILTPQCVLSALTAMNHVNYLCRRVTFPARASLDSASLCFCVDRSRILRAALSVLSVSPSSSRNCCWRSMSYKMSFRGGLSKRASETTPDSARVHFSLRVGRSANFCSGDRLCRAGDRRRGGDMVLWLGSTERDRYELPSRGRGDSLMGSGGRATDFLRTAGETDRPSRRIISSSLYSLRISGKASRSGMLDCKTDLVFGPHFSSNL